jgi:hypothetical protein
VPAERRSGSWGPTYTVFERWPLNLGLLRTQAFFAPRPFRSYTSRGCTVGAVGYGELAAERS